MLEMSTDRKGVHLHSALERCSSHYCTETQYVVGIQTISDRKLTLIPSISQSTLSSSDSLQTDKLYCISSRIFPNVMRMKYLTVSEQVRIRLWRCNSHSDCQPL